MNQILITEKLYVTPELKKKKKVYQFAFIISIICISMLSSYYIYAEYDRNTLANEYFRDRNKGINPELPYNYFPGNDPRALPNLTWRSYASLLYANWLNYYVYQQTPYNLADIKDFS